MGSGKITCVHITRENIRLVEGRVNNGVILVTRSAMVMKASRFFHGERLAFMSEMVTAIINTMNMNSFTSKELYIVYDNDLQVEFYLDEKLTGNRNRKGNSISLLKKDDGGKQKETGTITHKKAWGKYITEIEQGELYTTTKIERDLVDFMVGEFHAHGYKVASIEAPETAIMYLRKMVPFSYDALNKLVVCANNQTTGDLYQFTKDAPSGQDKIHFDAIQSTDFVSQVVETILDTIRKKSLHSPHIMLVGDAFSDTDQYIEICKELKEEGLFCIDLYSTWHDRGAPTNSIKVITPDENIDLGLNGSYGLCIALLARTMENKPENMVEGFHIGFIGKKTQKRIADVMEMAATLLLIYGMVFSVIGGYENYVAKEEFTRAANISEAQLSNAERERDIIKTKIDTVSTVDSRYNKILKFVYAQVNSDLNIASVDTVDMLPSSTSSSSAYAEDSAQPDSQTQEESEETQPPGPIDVTNQASIKQYTKKTIVIRGYSRTTDGPVELYKALVGAGIGEVKVVGVEQVPLPSNETLFAFELTVGTNGGA